MDILVVDDERVVREGLKGLLAGEGFSVRTARDGREALAKFDERRPDLVVLDVMMPKMNGFLACEEIRRRDRSVPVVFLTAKDAEADQVRALGLGADDYIAKDAGEAVLLARIKRAIERMRSMGETPEAEVFRVGTVTIDARTYAVSDDRGVRAWLTRTETDLLKSLHQADGAPVGVDALIEALRGGGFACEDNMLYTHVSRLRRKLGREGRRIVCRHGAGYCLVR